MRFAAAEVAMPQRLAARVTLPSSIAATKILRVTQSGGAAMPLPPTIHEPPEHRAQAWITEA